MGIISRGLDGADGPFPIPAKIVPRTTAEPPRVSNCVRAGSLPCCEMPPLTFHINSSHLLYAL